MSILRTLQALLAFALASAMGAFAAVAAPGRHGQTKRPHFLAKPATARLEHAHEDGPATTSARTTEDEGGS